MGGRREGEKDEGPRGSPDSSPSSHGHSIRLNEQQLSPLSLLFQLHTNLLSGWALVCPHYGLKDMYDSRQPTIYTPYVSHTSSPLSRASPTYPQIMFKIASWVFSNHVAGLQNNI